MKKINKILILDFMLLIVAMAYFDDFIVGILWILLHEGVHILVAKKFGCKLYSVDLNIIGAKASLGEVDDLDDRKKIILYLSGPIFNLIVAGVFFCVREYSSGVLFEEIIYINLALGLFNLIPAYPLDGGNILEIILNKRVLYKRAKNIVVIVSYCVAIAFVLLGMMTVYLHRVNISLFLTAGLITYTAYIDREKTMYIMMGDMIKKRKRLKEGSYIENKCVSVYYKKGLITLMGLVDKNKFNTFFILDEEMKILMIIHEDELIEALKDYGSLTVEEYINEKKNKMDK